MANDTSSTSETAASGSGQPRRIWPAIRTLLRTRIVAGLLTIVPIWITYELVRWLFGFVFGVMTSFTKPLATWLTEKLSQSPEPIVASTVQTWFDWLVPILALLITLFLLYCIGLASANVLGRRLILWVEWFFAKLPFVKGIYKATKQVVLLIGGHPRMGFQRVVLVEFPRPGMKCIGFLTAVMTDMDTGRKMASIFISTTPNPTTGYMQIVPLDEVSETDWSVDEAIKLLMSGGIISPPNVAFDKIHPVRWTAEDQAKADSLREEEQLRPPAERRQNKDT